MVNGFSQVGDAENVVYYDAPQYTDFRASAAVLGLDQKRSSSAPAFSYNLSSMARST